jgi:hypothetical protein
VFTDRVPAQVDCGLDRCRYSARHVRPCMGCSTTCLQRSDSTLHCLGDGLRGADIIVYPFLGWAWRSPKLAKGGNRYALTAHESKLHAHEGFSLITLPRPPSPRPTMYHRESHITCHVLMMSIILFPPCPKRGQVYLLLT